MWSLVECESSVYCKVFLSLTFRFLFTNLWSDLSGQVVRSRLQEQGQLRNSENHYTGVIDCVKRVFQKEGIAGFYRGCATNLLRTTPAAVITFTSFEMIHRFLLRVLPPEKPHSQTRPESGGPLKPQHESNIGETQDTALQSSQTQSSTNKRSPISLGKTDRYQQEIDDGFSPSRLWWDFGVKWTNILSWYSISIKN